MSTATSNTSKNASLLSSLEEEDWEFLLKEELSQRFFLALKIQELRQSQNEVNYDELRQPAKPADKSKELDDVIIIDDTLDEESVFDYDFPYNSNSPIWIPETIEDLDDDKSNTVDNRIKRCLDCNQLCCSGCGFEHCTGCGPAGGDNKFRCPDCIYIHVTYCNGYAPNNEIDKEEKEEEETWNPSNYSESEEEEEEEDESIPLPFTEDTKKRNFVMSLLPEFKKILLSLDYTEQMDDDLFQIYNQYREKKRRRL